MDFAERAAKQIFEKLCWSEADEEILTDIAEITAIIREVPGCPRQFPTVDGMPPDGWINAEAIKPGPVRSIRSWTTRRERR
jgi:hypothetical protein